jgi:hypothetical protein
MGVFAFWLTHFLRPLASLIAEGHRLYGNPVLSSFWFAGILGLASGVGVLLGLAAARGATSSLPVWLMGLVGVAFGFLTESVWQSLLRTIGLPFPEPLLGSLPAVAISAAIFAWLCAEIVQSLRRRFPKIRAEYYRVKSNRLEEASFLLALSPWVLGMTQALGVPGFG